MKTTFYLIQILALCLLTGCGNSNTSKSTNNKNPDATEVNAPINTIKPTINAYIENSGSMAGYVSGYSDFKDAVGDYLTNITISPDLPDSLNLFFINQSVQRIGYNINNYLSILTNSCNASTSDIAQLFQKVLSLSDDDKISIFVTDGIFSPDKGKNAHEYLKQQQKDIKEAVAKHLQKYPNTAIAVYQLSSNFNGIYYNCNDAQKKINAKRPYYIWVIGSIQNIAKLKMSAFEKNFKGGGIQHSFTLLPSLDKTVDYEILQNPKIGSFEKIKGKNTVKTHIQKLQKASNGKNEGIFGFYIGMDLSMFQLLLSDEYLMSANSYARLINKQINNDYYIEIEHNTNQNNNYTHNMKLTTEKIVTGELEIILRSQMPQWVYDINDDEGLDIFKDDAVDKTFGIKYLVEGVYEAYNIMRGNDIYTTMKFNLKR